MATSMMKTMMKCLLLVALIISASDLTSSQSSSHLHGAGATGAPQPSGGQGQRSTSVPHARGSRRRNASTPALLVTVRRADLLRVFGQTHSILFAANMNAAHVSLTSPMPFGSQGRRYDNVKIGRNGFLSFANFDGRNVKTINSISESDAVIAPLWTDESGFVQVDITEFSLNKTSTVYDARSILHLFGVLNLVKHGDSTESATTAFVPLHAFSVVWRHTVHNRSSTLHERKFQSVVATDGCTSKVVNSYVGSGSALPAGITARLTTAVNKLVSTKVIPQRDAYNVSMSSCGGMNPAAHTLCQTLRRVPLPSQAASASVSCPLVQFHADVLTTFTALPSNFLSPSVCYWTTPIADKLSNKSIATVCCYNRTFSLITTGTHRPFFTWNAYDLLAKKACQNAGMLEDFIAERQIPISAAKPVYKQASLIGTGHVRTFGNESFDFQVPGGILLADITSRDTGFRLQAIGEMAVQGTPNSYPYLKQVIIRFGSPKSSFYHMYTDLIRVHNGKVAIRRLSNPSLDELRPGKQIARDGSSVSYTSHGASITISRQGNATLNIRLQVEDGQVNASGLLTVNKTELFNFLESSPVNEKEGMTYASYLYNTSNLLTTRGVTVLEFVRVSRGAILKEGVTLQSLSLYRQNSSFLNDLARVNNIASHGNQRAEALRTLLVAQSTNQSEAYLVDSVRVGAQFGMETLRAEQINVIRREILAAGTEGDHTVELFHDLTNTTTMVENVGDFTHVETVEDIGDFTHIETDGHSIGNYTFIPGVVSIGIPTHIDMVEDIGDDSHLETDGHRIGDISDRESVGSPTHVETAEDIGDATDLEVSQNVGNPLSHEPASVGNATRAETNRSTVGDLRHPVHFGNSPNAAAANANKTGVIVGAVFGVLFGLMVVFVIMDRRRRRSQEIPVLPLENTGSHNMKVPTGLHLNETQCGLLSEACLSARSSISGRSGHEVEGAMLNSFPDHPRSSISSSSALQSEPEYTVPPMTNLERIASISSHCDANRQRMDSNVSHANRYTTVRLKGAALPANTHSAPHTEYKPNGGATDPYLDYETAVVPSGVHDNEQATYVNDSIA